ncbi:hypothetical protein CCP3SC15_1730001 [Gammaproteobacteria bacterium]
MNSTACEKQPDSFAAASMSWYADLHLHSKYSRATSRDCDLEHLALWAQKKGLAVIGSGDLTHPGWRAELREKLVPAEEGLYRLQPELEAAVAAQVPATCRAPVRFLLSGEISTIYKKGERTRKVHHVVYVPDLDTAEHLATRLARIGNLAADGRPILGLDSRHLLEIVLESGPATFLVPAHIWTPWFSVLGSRGGFDTVEECYGDLTPHIFALETGLSSDPEMNWRISALDRYRLVSNSDAHSPAKLGREATIFTGSCNYPAIRRALESGEGYVGTVEFFPEEGKYHLDGHRKCEVRLTPTETLTNGGCCPKCGDPVIVGVMHRVAALADRPHPLPPATAGVVRSLVPLPEILAEFAGTATAGKRVVEHEERLIDRFGPELHILSELPLEELIRASEPLLAEALTRLRKGAVYREAGYDGEYGVIRLFRPGELVLRY